jgi:hypothetical protein
MKELLGDVRMYISCHDVPLLLNYFDCFSFSLKLARWFGPDSRTNDEIEAGTDATARARFAYLVSHIHNFCNIKYCTHVLIPYPTET